MPFTPLRVSPVFGGLEVRTGDLDVTVGALTVGGLITGQNGLTLSAGNLAVSSGAITVSGNITSGGTIDGQAININGVPVGTSSDTYWNAETDGIYYGSNVRLSAGNLVVSAGTITASGNITTSDSFVGTGAIWIFSRNYASHILSNLTGATNDNTVFGYNSGKLLTLGGQNSLYGEIAGGKLTEGARNVFIGYSSGGAVMTVGNYNTYVGYASGSNATGNGGVFLGYMAGLNETGNDKLYIANSNTTTPLIYGIFPNTLVQLNASVILGRAADKVGFYGSAGALKPTITGSRDGNAAVASLLTELAALGLLTDGTGA